MSTKRPPGDEHERRLQEQPDASTGLPQTDPAEEQTQAPTCGRIVESDWAFIASPWLRDALRGAARHTLILAALLSGLVVAVPARAHTAGPAARGLSLAQAESATRAALAPLAVDAVYCFRAVSTNRQSSRRHALCLVAHPAPKGEACRSLVDVKRSRADRGAVTARVIAGQFCMRFDPSLLRVAGATVVHASAVPKAAQALAQQAAVSLRQLHTSGCCPRRSSAVQSGFATWCTCYASVAGWLRMRVRSRSTREDTAPTSTGSLD